MADADREQASEQLATAFDVPITVAGVLFVLVVVANNLTPAGSPWVAVWDEHGAVLDHIGSKLAHVS